MGGIAAFFGKIADWFWNICIKYLLPPAVKFVSIIGTIAQWVRGFRARFGRYMTVAFCLSVVGVIGNFLKLGLTTTIDMLKGVASDPYLTEGGSLLEWTSQSLTPFWSGLADIVPEFWRFIGWWFGLDWLAWSFICGCIFAFCGWILSIMVKAVAVVAGTVLKWL